MTIDPIIAWTLLGVAVLLAAASVAVRLLARAGRLEAKVRCELRRRIRTWAFLVPALVVPVALGPLWIKVGAGLLGLLCFREFSRATGLFRERGTALCTYGSIILLTVANLLRGPDLLLVAAPLFSLLIVAGGILSDRPEGYLQRSALGVLGFLLFGLSFAHLGLLADRLPDAGVFIWLFLCVCLNDVTAYLCGRLWGHRKLCPNTSPGKTVAGALGGLVSTALLAVVFGRAMGVFDGSPAALLLAGALCSLCGTMGDLVVSSIKRDLHIKDMSNALPGHGGVLDRFDSLILAAPAAFYFVLAVEWLTLPDGAALTFTP